MNYKKKYDEALERAKSFKTPELRDVAEYIFPELRESEDDKIREQIIYAINKLNVPESEKNKLLAWLEKQGEQKPTLPKWKYKKDNTTLLKDSLVLNKCGHMAKLSSGAIVSDVWVLDYDELAKLPKEELEEQSEQNPTDNVEPKFKIGDYIERKDGVGCHAKIIFVGGNFYGCEKLIYPEDESPFFEFMFENQDEFRVSSDFQQKLAWNEEDDDAWMNDIISKVENNLQLNKAEIDWIKLLKERYFWKPSDEQITVLELASKYERVFTPKQIDILIDLKEQLKKLKGE